MGNFGIISSVDFLAIPEGPHVKDFDAAQKAAKIAERAAMKAVTQPTTVNCKAVGPRVYSCRKGDESPEGAIYVGRKVRDRKTGEIVFPDTPFGNHYHLPPDEFREYAETLMQDEEFRPLVEALKYVTAGCTLPSGVTLTYDPANTIAPLYYAPGSGGLPIKPYPDQSGDYADFETDWGFAINVCAHPAGIFAANYAYVQC